MRVWTACILYPQKAKDWNFHDTLLYLSVTRHFCRETEKKFSGSIGDILAIEENKTIKNQGLRL